MKKATLRRNIRAVPSDRPVRTHLILVFLSLVFIVSGCSHPGWALRENQSSGLSLEACISQFPAENSVIDQLLAKRIITLGPDSLNKMILQLNSEDQARVRKTQYAVNSVVRFAGSREGPERLKDLIQKTLIKSFRKLGSFEHKRFLLDQLYLVAGDASIVFLEQLLSDPDLGQPAVTILSTIGSKQAGSVLLAALKQKAIRKRADAVQALGSMEYEPAADFLMNIARDEEDPNRMLAFEALVRINAPDIKNGIANSKLSLKEKTRLMLEFATRKEDNQNNSEAYETYKSIFNNERVSQGQRLAAFEGLFRQNRAGNRTIIEKALTSPDPVIFTRAVNMLESDPERYTAEDFSRQLALVADSRHTALIEMAGRKGEPSLAADIVKYTRSANPDLRQAAMQAIFNLDRALYADLIEAYLKVDITPEELHALEGQLEEFAVSDLIKFTTRVYQDLPENSKILLIRVCAKKEIDELKELYFESLNSGTSDLSREAAAALRNIVTKNDADRLLNLLREHPGTGKSRDMRTLLAAILKRANHPDDILAYFKKYYDTQDDSVKTELIQLYRQIGGRAALKMIVDIIQDGNSSMRKNGVRALALWPDENALDPLLDHIKTKPALNEQVLCIRGYVRLLRNPAIPDQRVIHALSRLRELELRSEEKGLIIGALGTRQTQESYRLIIDYLDTDTIRQQSKEILFPRTQLDMDVPEGFEMLFNGRDLNGWKGLVANPAERKSMTTDDLNAAQIEADQKMREHWHVLDGVLFFDGNGENLCTIKDYRNFELLVDWKIEKGGDSGIYLRGTPQVQIWDPDEHPEGSGGLFNNQKTRNKPLIRADNPVGQWNHFRIIMRGQKVTVFLNDQLVVDGVAMENYWERHLPIYAAGPVELQAHYTPLYFKNMFIRELSDSDTLFTGNLLNDESLDGWQIIDNNSDSWSVKNGVLSTSGEGGGWIGTKNAFSNFKLKLDFRLPEGGNSGVFLRAPLKGDPAYTGMEIQVLDDNAKIYEELKPWQYTASLYGLQAPVQQHTKPAGVWQTMEIVCDGPFIKVDLNGKTVNEINLIDYMKDEQKHPGIKRRKGFIGLQNHGSRVEYRNIYLQELPDRRN